MKQLKTKVGHKKPSVLRAAGTTSAISQTTYKTVKIEGLDIFYREAGPKNAHTILLLHGYPTSSHMFRNLINDLSDRYHLLAPDYPGYGRSEQPPMSEFDYTFDNMSKIIEGFLDALNVEKFSIYLMDYGAPIGYRIAAKYPQRVEALIIQNGNAYDEGLKEFWIPIKKYWNEKTVENGKALEGFHAPEGLKWQYTHGVRDVEKISPDNWHVDLRHLTRPENDKIQLAMFYDYRTNVPLYPEWQAYFREYQPPTLIVWGKNDHIFPADGAHPYKRDLKNIEFHLLDTGHFALEEDGDVIASLIREFMGKNVDSRNDVSQIKTLLKGYEHVLNASDVNGILKLYAHDGVFMPQHSPSHVGTDAIRIAYENVFEAIDLDVEFDIIEVEVLSDQWAFARTTSSGTTTINADGAKVSEGNQELFLLQKQLDGEWKIARYIFSTTNPRQ